MDDRRTGGDSCTASSEVGSEHNPSLKVIPRQGVLWSALESRGVGLRSARLMPVPTTSHRQPVVLDLASALYGELEKAHRSPRVLASPDLIPVMAELALSLDADGSPGHCERAVSKLLHKALTQIHSFDDCSAEEIGIATGELLGLTVGTWKNQADRFENAASELSVYSNGESLRKSIRTKSDGQKQKVWLIFYELLIDQLVAIAKDTGFAPTGRFMTDGASQRPLASRVSAVAVRKQVSIVAAEIGMLFSYGGTRVVSESHVPCIIALATALYPHGGTPLEKVEALFTWTVHHARWPKAFDSLDERRLRAGRAQAILELAGFGKIRDVSDHRPALVVTQLLLDGTYSTTSMKTHEYFAKREAAVRAMAWLLWELMNEQGVEIVGRTSSYWEHNL